MIWLLGYLLGLALAAIGAGMSWGSLGALPSWLWLAWAGWRQTAARWQLGIGLLLGLEFAQSAPPWAVLSPGDPGRPQLFTQLQHSAARPQPARSSRSQAWCEACLGGRLEFLPRQRREQLVGYGILPLLVWSGWHVGWVAQALATLIRGPWAAARLLLPQLGAGRAWVVAGLDAAVHSVVLMFACSRPGSPALLRGAIQAMLRVGQRHISGGGGRLRLLGVAATGQILSDPSGVASDASLMSWGCVLWLRVTQRWPKGSLLQRLWSYVEQQAGFMVLGWCFWGSLSLLGLVFYPIFSIIVPILYVATVLIRTSLPGVSRLGERLVTTIDLIFEWALRTCGSGLIWRIHAPNTLRQFIFLAIIFLCLKFDASLPTRRHMVSK